MSRIEHFNQQQVHKQNRAVQSVGYIEAFDLNRLADEIQPSGRKKNPHYASSATAYFINPVNESRLLTGDFKVGNKYSKVFWLAYLGVIAGLFSLLMFGLAQPSVRVFFFDRSPDEAIPFAILSALGAVSLLVGSIITFFHRTRIVREGRLLKGAITGAIVTRARDNVMMGVRYRFTTPDGETLERDQWQYRNDLLQKGLGSSQIRYERVPSRATPCYVLYLDRHTFRLL